jgi:hypothetical protein
MIRFKNTDLARSESTEIATRQFVSPSVVTVTMSAYTEANIDALFQ